MPINDVGLRTTWLRTNLFQYSAIIMSIESGAKPPGSETLIYYILAMLPNLSVYSSVNGDDIMSYVVGK